jgi:hypothetical protein
MKKTFAFILALVFLMICFINLAGCATTNTGTYGLNTSAVLTGKDITKDKIQIAFIPEHSRTGQYYREAGYRCHHGVIYERHDQFSMPVSIPTHR